MHMVSTIVLTTMLVSIVHASVEAEINTLREAYKWPSGVEAIHGSTPSQDCQVAQLAYQYGLSLQPRTALLRQFSPP